MLDLLKYNCEIYRSIHKRRLTNIKLFWGVYCDYRSVLNFEVTLMNSR